MFRSLLLMLFCGPYSRASANSAEGLALLKTLYGKVCAESTGEACSLLEARMSTIESRAIQELSSKVNGLSNSTAKIVELNNFLSPLIDPEEDNDDCCSDDTDINQKLESFIQGQKYYRNCVYNALTACIILLAITISANLHLYITNCLERRKVKRNASRHRRAAMLYSDLQSIHRQHTAPV